MIFIMNFNNSRNLNDIKKQFDQYHGTNINYLLDDSPSGHTRWFVPKSAIPGDTIFFMCAKEARHNLGMATAHMPSDASDEFVDFVKDQKDLYKKYSGHIVGYGIVNSIPEDDDGWWMSDIDHLHLFINPIYIDDFKSFISISKRNSITYIDDAQWNRLKWVTDQKNPGVFPDAVPPDEETLKKEFEDSVRKASGKPLDQLKKQAEKNKSQSVPSTVQAKVYHRDPVIAAFVKRRANGYCQLCGMKAPFVDRNGEPYLECHHLNWLSQGGQDAADNCVALCPNCHRKMHAINDPEDIRALKAKISS